MGGVFPQFFAAFSPVIGQIDRGLQDFWGI
jgi:hypothetical protein